MSQAFYQNFKLGILGGGQLGRMMIQAGIDFNIQFAVLDPDAEAPCSTLADFTQGKLTEYESVLKFGEQCDLITIEIENVNVDALKTLARKGKKVFPQPEVIEMIQDKRKQKEFYLAHGVPTADFILTENNADARRNGSFLPAVSKLGKAGYDGKGVKVLKDEGDLDLAFDSPGLLEKWIDFEKEIAVIVARNERGEVSTYPAVEMVFHPEANLVEYNFMPAAIDEHIAAQADTIARTIITKLGMIGLLAVEMFLTKDGRILVNEIAPRPHNSGHQTIEGSRTSQFHQHLRAILNLPLGDTATSLRSAMVNLLGSEGHSGVARYQGLEKVLSIEGVHVHLYGKKMTKPFRKMGHVTIVEPDMESLKKKVNFVKDNLKIVA